MQQVSLVGPEISLGYFAVGGILPCLEALLRAQEGNLLREAAPWLIYAFLGAKTAVFEGYKNNWITLPLGNLCVSKCV